MKHLLLAFIPIRKRVYWFSLGDTVARRNRPDREEFFPS
jgi:hypothetical protein